MRITLVFAVAATTAACDSGGPANGPPASLAKSAGDQSQTVVGQPVTPAPAVKVTDDQNRAVPGVTVTFAVASGGGSVSNATPATGADGVATVGSWTLGTTAGANTLTASVPNLTPVTFTATGTAGPAATITKASTDAQESHIGSAVSPRPSVRLQDAFGNAVTGTAVTFAVASGGGTATGTAQTADAGGVATVGSWTLGASAGTNTLSASTGSLTPVTFTTAGVDMCGRAPEHFLGGATSGALSTGDCPLSSGQYVDKYTIVRGALTPFRLDQKSTAVDSRLVLFSLPDNRLVQSAPTGNNAAMNYIVGAGSFIVGASSVNTAATGAYSLESTVIPESVDNCATYVLVNLPTTSQTVASSDCADNEASGTYYFDVFVFFVQEGQTYTVKMTTSAFNPYIEIQTLSGSLRNTASASGSGTRTAKSTFTPTVTEHRVVLASTVNIGQTGAYTLSVELGSGGSGGSMVSAGATGPSIARPVSRFVSTGADLQRVLRSFRSVGPEPARNPK